MNRVTPSRRLSAFNCMGQLGREQEGDLRAAMGAMSGAGVVCRQFEQRQSGELLLPVIQLLFEHLARKPLPLPHGEVRVLHLQLRKPGLLPCTIALIERGELSDHHSQSTTRRSPRDAGLLPARDLLASASRARLSTPALAPDQTAVCFLSRYLPRSLLRITCLKVADVPDRQIDLARLSMTCTGRPSLVSNLVRSTSCRRAISPKLWRSAV